jgi:hypothetical protein
MKLERTFGLIFACATFAGVLAAQTSGVLNGKVTDHDGKPVPSASVMVSGASGLTQTAVTMPDGDFSIANLPPGIYRVEVHSSGYKSLRNDNVDVAANIPVTLPLPLAAGSPAETVEVQGQQSLAQVQNAEIGRAYSRRSLADVPVQDLSSQQQVERMPGITPPVPWTPYTSSSSSVAALNTPRGMIETSNSILSDPQTNRVWNTNGQPAQANDHQLDGVENVEAFSQIEAHVPAVNSLEEMAVATSNYDVSAGRAAGSVLTHVIGSGSAGFHGTLFDYHANDWFRARNYFNPRGTPQARFTSNQFGGTIGGSIVPNKTFVFLSYEGDYVRDRTSTIATVPTSAFRTGNFSALPGITISNPFTGTATGAGRTPFTGGVIPAALLNRSAAAILAALPAPNLPGLVNNYAANVPMTNDGNRADVRIDHRFSDQTTMFLRYGLSYYNTAQQSLFPGLGADGGNSRLRAHTALASFSHTFNPATFTTLRLSIIRYSDPINPLSGFGGGAFGFTGATGELPFMQIDGITALGSNPNYPQINKDQSFNIKNDWNAHIFKNDIRLGFDIWQIRTDGFQRFLYGPQGGYTFTPGATMVPGAAVTPFSDFGNSLAAFLLGTPTTAGITTSSYVPSYLSGQFGGYIADRWKLASRLTLDFGVRYDYFGPVEPRNNASNYSIFNPLTNTLTPLGSNPADYTILGGIGIINNGTAPGRAPADRVGNVRANHLDFQPRVGLVFRFNDRTVIRAGYGMSYWTPGLQFSSASLLPFTTGVETGVAGSYGVGGTLGVLPMVPAAATGLATNRTLYYSPSTMRDPYVQFYNFGIQRDLTHNILAEVAYVGNLSRDLPYTWNTNAALPGTGLAGLPYAPFGRTADTFLRGTGFNSNYNALQINLTKRYSAGLSFSLAYTFSKALDYYGAGLSPFLNNLNPRANYGPADFDRTQVLTFSHNFRLPFGAGTRYLNKGIVGRILGPWELDGIYRYATGAPFTPVGSDALCACPGNTPVASFGGGAESLGTTGFPGLAGFPFPFVLRTSGYAQPAFGTLGSIGRNSIRGQNFTNYDLALSRSFVFVEQTRLDLRAEAYNLANSANFGIPAVNITSANFGRAWTTAPGLGARTVQFALRLIF